MLKIFKDIRGVEVFMSEKKDKNMKLFLPETDENRKKYLEKIGLELGNLVASKLVHGGDVEIIKNTERSIIDDVDGLLTNNPDFILSVTSADCLPIFLFDPVKKVAGILHCGWRSVAKGIIENALGKMKNNFGSESENILVGIGPGIQSCHFEVEEDLIKNFSGCEGFIINENGGKYFDLTGLVKERLISNRIRPENIEIDHRCSYCEKELWSYRRDGKFEGEVQAGMGGIRLR
ncbi:MAG: polyphenol oxidase family protein [Candidatus Moranbacteria bacterium]|nr:polyphenol oxidase family protein [Candidatus Moranbacteria bacterium]